MPFNSWCPAVNSQSDALTATRNCSFFCFALENKLMICNNDISIRTAAQRIAFSAKSDQAADQIGEIVWLRRIETRP